MQMLKTFVATPPAPPRPTIMTRQIIDSLHRCLCPQFFNSLPIRTHSSVAVLSTKRLSPLSRVTRSFSSPSLTVPSQFTPETESQSGTSIYSQPPIRKILKVPTGTRRVARERFRGDSYIKYRLPPPEYSGINKVIDLVGQSVYPDIFLAAEELVRYEGYVPDAKLYTILIEACANFPGCLFQPLAFQLLGEMKERGLQPNSAIYHSLLRVSFYGVNLLSVCGGHTAFNGIKKEMLIPPGY